MINIQSYIIRVVILTSSFTIPNISYAEMYKWVDEEGNTHYTEKRPAGNITTETIGPPSSVDTDAAQKTLSDSTKKADKIRDERIKKSEELEKEEQELSQKKEKCEKARKAQASYERPRVNYVDDEGNRRRGTEEERQLDLAKAKENVKKLCDL